MKYIIHACNKRIWYVEGFLIPSMKAQGIPDKEIEINEDTELLGCLFSTLKGFQKCSADPGGTWHLQDDVVLSRDFYEKTKQHDDGVVMGFWHRYKNRPDLHAGKTSVKEMTYSFPCMRVPNDVAGEFVRWFEEEAKWREKYARMIEEKKYVDVFFRDFMKERHSDGFVNNLKPSIVDHVDWLIGGSTINKWRLEICRAAYWEDESIIEELKEQLAHRKS